MAQEWRWGARMARVERDQQSARADANAGALDSLQADLQTIGEAATRAAAVAPQLTARVGVLSQALKNATPLPTGCRPDDLRVRTLTDSVRAARDAAAGQRPGGTVPANP